MRIWNGYREQRKNTVWKEIIGGRRGEYHTQRLHEFWLVNMMGGGKLVSDKLTLCYFYLNSIPN